MKTLINLQYYFERIITQEYVIVGANLIKHQRSSPPQVSSVRSILKICSKFAEHPCRSAISRKLQSNFIEIALPYGCFPVNLLPIFRTAFLKNTSGGLLLTLLPNKESFFSNLNILQMFLNARIIRGSKKSVEYPSYEKYWRLS